MMGHIDNTGCYATPDAKLSLNHQPSQQDSEFDLLEALLAARVDPETELEPPPVLLSINGKPAFTLGNISLIIGKAKSMKTFFLCMVVARILGAVVEAIDIFDNIKVVFFDTEQSRFDVKRFIDRVSRLVGAKIMIDVFCLRPYSPRERKRLIDAYLQQNPDTSICFIDGIRDLVTDVNSPDQATEIATWLMWLTEELHIHICTVLHQNKGDANARGHLGTELVNKAETTISITKDKRGGFSVVEAEYTRGKEFDPFAIEVDEQGLPRTMDNWMPERLKKPSEAPDSFEKMFHETVLKHAFGITETPKYSDLIQNLKVAFQQEGFSWGDNKIKNFITYYIDKGMIMQEGTKGTRYSHYKLCAQ